MMQGQCITANGIKLNVMTDGLKDSPPVDF
jgi:hypothetical protein